jgi:hypothetical protein
MQSAKIAIFQADKAVDDPITAITGRIHFLEIIYDSNMKWPL